MFIMKVSSMKVLSLEVSSKIRIFGKRIKFQFRSIIAVLYLFTLVYFLVQVWLNSAYTPTVQSFILWVIVFPLYWFYIVYGAYASIVVVMMASGYLHMRQQPILRGLKQLNRILKSDKLSNTMFITFYRHYLKLNRMVSYICVDTQAYSHYCQPYLTVVFPFYVVLQCYFAYIVFLVHTSPFVEKQHFLYALVVLEGLLFAIIYQCARIVTTNKQIVCENRRFFQLYQLQKGCDRSIRTIQLLKTELLQTPRLLHKYSFRVGYLNRISNNTFSLIISYISVLFLSLIKNQRNK